MIRFDRVTKRYANGVEALSGVSFHLTRGEMAFVTGHSGAGKSTLLKLMLALEQPTRGEVLFDGQNLSRCRRSQMPLIRRRIGMVYQNHRLLLDRSVFENVALPLDIAGMSRTDTQRRVRAALDKVGLLARERHFPQMLSGGEQQRVGIARAIVHKPPLLLADEPTGNLDPDLSLEIMALFREFNRVGVSVMVVTHDLALVARMPCRFIGLKDGRVASDVG